MTSCEATFHFQQRAQQRGISDRDINAVLDYGREFHRAGGVFFSLRNRQDLPPDLRHQWPRLGKIVLVKERRGRGDWGPWLTCYKRDRPLRHICKKPKHVAAFVAGFSPA